jgi:hypothetical protein
VCFRCGVTCLSMLAKSRPPSVLPAPTARRHTTTQQLGTSGLRGNTWPEVRQCSAETLQST